MSEFWATRAQVEECLGHLMWCTEPEFGDGVACSCGFENPDTCFDDLVVLTDLRRYSGHLRCLVAFPKLPDDDPASSETLIAVLDDEPFRVRDADLEWLLEQPDLSEEFRRAAAVHLNT